jgi:hypothetical protein
LIFPFRKNNIDTYCCNGLEEKLFEINQFQQTRQISENKNWRPIAGVEPMVWMCKVVAGVDKNEDELKGHARLCVYDHVYQEYADTLA